MIEKEKREGMLSPYRALDLADETGLLCGKALADLGADVIKIEPPCGDPARSLGPFYHDEPDPEKSLFWFAYNTNKRGITLNIETTDGREIFKKLVKTADWVIESFPPGYMRKIGLGYSVLEKINPGVILVSITPFGQTGPWKGYKAPDIVAWALGGQMYAWGDADRPPLHISYHSHAHLHAGAEATIGALAALYDRVKTGEGQWVNASIQQAATQATQGVVQTWEWRRENRRRGERASVGVSLRLRTVWPCRNGSVRFSYSAGPQGKRQNLPIINWMKNEGVADDFLMRTDWESFDFNTLTQEVVDRLEELTAKFFMSRTTIELFEGGVNYDFELYPIATTKDVLENTQLAARKFWVELEHPELGTSITYPGGFAQASNTPLKIWRRAPLIGEHNQEIYEKELGLSKEELTILKQAEVI